jgi:hypothetical protein
LEEKQMGRLLDEDIVIDALIGISGSKSIEELTEECEVYQSDNRCYSGGVYGAIRAIKTLPSVQPEPAIPLSWIENKIKWLKSLDNTFSEITALQISVMVKKWRDEQNETD